MQRTLIFTKKNKVYVQREFQIAEDRWQPVVRLAYETVGDAVARNPKFLPGATALENREKVHQPMECRNCGFVADESDFVPTDELGERICPKCGSNETYVVTI